MPGLLRGIARTAVISGTATAVSNRLSRRQGERWAAHEQRSDPPPGVPAPPPADRIAALAQLGELRAQGVLSEQELAAEKARILAS